MVFAVNTYRIRLAKIRESMERAGIDALFLPRNADLMYFTGLPRTAPEPTETHTPGRSAYGAVITMDEIIFIMPKLASLMGIESFTSNAVVDEVIIIDESRDMEAVVERALSPLAVARRVGVPDLAMATTVVDFCTWFPHVQVVSVTEMINRLRRVKTSEELQFMHRAASMADQVFEQVVSSVSVGMTEKDIATEVERLLGEAGSEGVSFSTGIMIRGPEAEELNGKGGGRELPLRLQAGDTLSFDFGAVSGGYCSDFGRTVYVGKPGKEVRRIHELVMNAQRAGIEALVAGTGTCAKADQMARSVIEDGGYGSGFMHRLGHGIGLDVHEAPFLTHTDDTVLRSGMTFTVEPSVFARGYGLVRVEDVVVVTPEGGQCLNRATKEIMVIDG